MDSGDSWVHRALRDLDAILSSKNADYRIDGEFSNFTFAADISGTSVEEVMLTQIAIKLGRLKGLPADPNNESRKDTVKDLAGYAVILYGYIKSITEDYVEF